MKQTNTSWKKWEVINKKKYPNDGVINEYVYGKCLPYTKIIGYEKNKILYFYFGVGKSKFQQMAYDKTIIFKLYTDAFNKIKHFIKLKNYKGEIGFELTEFKQLNIVVEYMIERFGYKTKKENDSLIILLENKEK